MREFIVQLQNKNAPELQVVFSGVHAISPDEAEKHCLRMMFAPVWFVMEIDEVQ